MTANLEVDPAHADAFTAAVRVACISYRLDRHDAVELVGLVYEHGVTGDLCVNDVIDLVQDADPDIESGEFVPDIARILGHRAE